MLKLAHSMMNGLAYLHDEVALPGGERRSLAHRDIKSKNIMIKNDMTAAIADFGLALCFKDGNVNEVDAQVSQVFLVNIQPSISTTFRMKVFDFYHRYLKNSKVENGLNVLKVVVYHEYSA